MTSTWVSAVRAATVAVVAAFLGVLGWYLGQPGYTWTRLVFFAVLGGFAVAGAAGVVYQRKMMVVGSACGLLLLGFWQAVLWIFIFPVIGTLLVALLVLPSDERSNSSISG